MTPGASDVLGGYHELAQPARVAASAVFVGVLFLTAVLERLQYQLRATESSRWWASNGRDVVNAFTLATVSVGLELLGFTGPMALLLAGSLVVLLTGLQASLERWPHATLLSAVISFALGIPILVAPRSVDALVRSVVQALFP